MLEAFNIIEEAEYITITKDGEDTKMYSPEVLCYPSSSDYFEIIDCNDRSMLFKVDDLVSVNKNRILFKNAEIVIS